MQLAAQPNKQNVAKTFIIGQKAQLGTVKIERH